MPSPDFSPYIDLTLYDKDPGSIYLDAITYAQDVALPEFNPRVGSVEEALLQAVSYATSQLVGTVNRIPNGLMEGILNLYGFERQQSISARVTILVEIMSTTSDTTIPTGALFSYSTLVDGVQETYFFSLVEDIVITAGNTTGTGECECLLVGVIPTIPAGEVFAPVTGAVGVLSAESYGTMTQGEDEETDISYFQRGAAFLASRSESLATSTQMQNYLGVYAQEIQRAYVSDLTQFRYMRVSSVERTGPTVTAVVEVGTDWTAPTEKCSFIEGDVTVGVTRIIVRYADDAAADEAINGTSTSGSTYIIDSASYDNLAGTYTITFDTASSLDMAVEYLPVSSAPFHSVTSDGVSPDPYIEILIQPTDYNDVPGAVGLVFGKSTGLPVRNSAYQVVQNAVRDKSTAGLVFTSIAPLMVDVTIDAVIEHKPTYGAVSVRQAVETALEAYLSPSTWQFNSNVYRNTLIGVASSVAGVARVISLDIGLSPSEVVAEYITDDGGYIAFAYPFTLPNVSSINVTGAV